MTNTSYENSKGVIRPSKSPRTPNTLRLAHLMEETQRLEIGHRIRQLREKSRWTQPDLAEKLGLSLRGYQKLEEKGTTKFERAEAVARIHGVDAGWIWEGTDKGPTPDVLGALGARGGADQLTRLERKVDALLKHAGLDHLLEELGPLEVESSRIADEEAAIAAAEPDTDEHLRQAEQAASEAAGADDEAPGRSASQTG